MRPNLTHWTFNNMYVKGKKQRWIGFKVQMLDRVVVVDVPGSVDAGGVTVAAAPGEVSANGVLSDGSLPDGVFRNGVLPVGVLPDVVLSDGFLPSAVIAARAAADVGVPDGGVAPGGGPVLLRLRRLPVFLLTSGPLARCRGGGQSKKTPSFHDL